MFKKETVIFINGMTCQSCVHHIESVLMQEPGVKLVKVSLEQKFSYVCYSPSLTSPSRLASLVDDIGFEASLDNCDTLCATWINVGGMTCQSCVQHIERMVRDVVGVRSVHVSLSDSLATVVYDNLQTSPLALCTVIDSIGFDAELLPSMTVDDSAGSNDDETKSLSLEPGDEFTKLASTRTKASQETCEISVEGMTCGSCVKNIESTISSVSGINSICVSLDQKKAVVVFNPAELSPEAVAEKIDDMGFEAAVLVSRSRTDHNQDKMSALEHLKPDDVQSFAGQTIAELHVTGMHCQSCIRSIEGHLKSIAGVVSIKVTLERELCHVIYDSSCISAESLCQAVENAGDFKASISGMFIFSSHTHNSARVLSG